MVHMQIQPLIRTRQATEVWGFKSPPAITFSLYLSQKCEGGGCQQLLTETLFRRQDVQHLHVGRPTLNLGTGRSVSLYLVQRRPILGSRTISTGGIPGFCGSREGDKNTVSRTATPHGQNLLQSRIAEKRGENGCMCWG